MNGVHENLLSWRAQQIVRRGTGDLNAAGLAGVRLRIQEKLAVLQEQLLALVLAHDCLFLNHAMSLIIIEIRGSRARARRERALQTLSKLVGALVLARAVAAADPALSDEILAANRRGLR
jgi:hypothetical protein